eukprot:CAMPEP_0204890636 /NCGR_PEP_ID=MMETSP1349-20130617/25534_1 /ASSEMBLY_ACC=CAM_ASM_000710 /TAXON_ID=215587 /ORGANISM="Aplanochytrium stocchinoi, Strain GSBS06" /LENGTH=306 /DNA_ID=CAMNT_0052055485 /DNA_START=178 /DNA_END=1095 /DNA_ORIENTATION=+
MDTFGKAPARFFEPRKTSYKLFMGLIKRDEEGNLDTSQVFSKACYDAWVSSRIRKPKRPDESFRRALVSHISGSDGRKPFPKDVEASLLKFIRQRKTWECFQGSNGASIGILGYKTKGYHESERDSLRQDQQQQQQANDKESAMEMKDTDNPSKSESGTLDNDIQCTALTVKKNSNPEFANGPDRKKKRARKSMSSGAREWSGLQDLLVRMKHFYDNESIANNALRIFSKTHSDLVVVDSSMGNIFLNLNPDKDPRLRKDFLLPNINSFDNSGSIGSFMMDSRTFTILGAQNCESILGNSPVNTNW